MKQDELSYLRSENWLLRRKLEVLEGDRDKFLATDDCYYWTPEGQRERDEIKAALTQAVDYLKQGKAKFAPNTTNSFVDDFIAKWDKK